jgi:hypothetical protein
MSTTAVVAAASLAVAPGNPRILEWDPSATIIPDLYEY